MQEQEEDLNRLDQIEGRLNWHQERLDAGSEIRMELADRLLAVEEHQKRQDDLRERNAERMIDLEERLVAACRAELGSQMTPRRVFVVDELPRSDAGKLYRQRLVERFT